MPHAGWLGLVVALVLLALVAAVCSLLMWRALHLYRRWGTVECRVRVGGTWRRGLAQLRPDGFAWYTFLSMSLRRTLWLHRSGLELLAHERLEADASGRPVVEARFSDGETTAELRLAPSALQGLIGWAEGAPPRVREIS